MRSHPKYDSIIENKINERLQKFMIKKDYQGALYELHDIITETKNIFVNIYIGSESNINQETTL